MTSRRCFTILHEGRFLKSRSLILDEKTKELVAVGVSEGARCQPCLTWHVAKARELGIGEELTQEAII